MTDNGEVSTNLLGLPLQQSGRAAAEAGTASVSAASGVEASVQNCVRPLCLEQELPEIDLNSNSGSETCEEDIISAAKEIEQLGRNASASESSSSKRPAIASDSSAPAARCGLVLHCTRPAIRSIMKKVLIAEANSNHY